MLNEISLDRQRWILQDFTYMYNHTNYNKWINKTETNSTYREHFDGCQKVDGGMDEKEGNKIYKLPVIKAVQGHKVQHRKYSR